MITFGSHVTLHFGILEINEKCTLLVAIFSNPFEILFKSLLYFISEFTTAQNTLNCLSGLRTLNLRVDYAVIGLP